MASHGFIGTWEISYIKGEYCHETNEIYGLKGARFRLDETGDVTWTVPEEFKSIPLFSCETYEIYSRPVLGIYVRFGAYAGHVIQFRASEPRDKITLICKEWGTLHCRRVQDDPKESNHIIPFSLLPALEDGYFSDIKISASNNKQFKIHSSIVKLQGSDILWHSQPPPFTGLFEDVLGTILHFLYAECLPNNLTEAAARQVIAAAAPYPSLNKLVNMCEVYLKNMALKQQIIVLVNDMHGWINQIIERFTTRQSYSATEENIAANPAKLCFVIKQSVRDAAVAGAKLLLLCDLFNKRKNELSREERHEIIRYARLRLPIFLTQLQRFLEAFKTTFSSMSASQRHEVAAYLVPEIEIILDTISVLVDEIEKALLQIIQVLSPHDNMRTMSSVADMLGKSLRSILHIRELTKLRNFHEHITCSLGLLLHKRENFNEMTPPQKVRSVARNLEQLIEELPPLLLRVEEVTAALDEKLEWKDFKFCFKVGTSKVAGVLQKLTAHKEKLQKVIMQVCELVQRETFTQSMHSLGLLDASTTTTHSVDAQKMTKSSSLGVQKQHQPGSKLNLVESLCVSPAASKSALSKLSLELLRSGQGTDMEFEIVNASNEVTASNEQGDEEASAPTEEEGVATVKAHRVIVAARCDWFRRALLSGMRESIDKKIVVHDTNIFLFRIFLEYLYSGCLNHNNLNTDQLAELLLLSDRYEVDSLKQACEYALHSSIDQDTVLYFLSMADQFNAEILKSACLNYVSHHQELTENEIFFELPMALQAEVFDCVWTQPPPPPPPGNSDTELSSIQQNVSGLRLSSDMDHSNSSSLEDLHFSQNSARLDSCIAQLRDIVGDTAPREKLVQVILAADYNPCRAINYFYSKSEDE